MSVHSCPECGLDHSAPERAGDDPMVKVAKIEAERDVEVAKISAGVSRDEMLREIDALRAELTVRQEEPPVAETTVTETVVEPDPDPEPEIIPVSDPGPAPEETPPPPETEPKPEKPKKRGWWDGYSR